MTWKKLGVLALVLAGFGYLRWAEVATPAANEPWEVFICEWSQDEFACAGPERGDLEACLPLHSDLLFKTWQRRPADPPTGIDFYTGPIRWESPALWRDGGRNGSLWHCIRSGALPRPTARN